MRIIVGGTRLQRGRGVIRAVIGGGAADLHDGQRQQQETSQYFEIHRLRLSKNKPRVTPKGKRPTHHILMKRVTPMMNAAIEAATTMAKLPRMIYSHTVEMTVMMEGSRFKNL